MSVTPEEATQSLGMYRWMNEMSDSELDAAFADGFGDDFPTSDGVASRMVLNLGLYPSDHWHYFVDKSLSGAYKAYLELKQLPAHDRERDLLERTGLDGRAEA